MATGIRSAYKEWRAHHHHGPENNLQLEAGYVCADCASSKNLSLQSGGGPYILGSFTTYLTRNALAVTDEIPDEKPTYSYQTGLVLPGFNLDQTGYSKLEEARRDSIHAKCQLEFASKRTDRACRHDPGIEHGVR